MAESPGHNFYELLDSKSSSDETTDRSDQNDETGSVIARSYECVFCKRGFTSAQALGGHMNIHRKDRALKTTTRVINRNNNDPNFVSSNKLGEENYASTTTTTTFRSFLAVQSYPPLQYLARAPEGIHVNTYNFPVAATWGTSTTMKVPPHEVLLHGGGDDLRAEYLSLSLGIGTAPRKEEGIDNEKIIQDDYKKEKKSSGRDFREDVEVDLELRLGYDP